MRWLYRFLLVASLVGLAARSAHAAPPLTEVQVITLPGVEHRIDHMAIDPAGKRLFVAALGNGTLEVLDLAKGTRITSVSGLKEPQGVAYVPQAHRIVVAMRGGGVAAFDDVSYARAAFLPNLADADNLRWDGSAGQLYLGYGAGVLAALDASTLMLAATVPLGAHPESFRLEESGARVFVNVPDKREFLVVDRRAHSIVRHVSLGRVLNNYPMWLDEAGQRLFIGARQPAELLVFDTTSFKQLAAVPCAGDTDDLFYDAHRQRVYVIGGEGYVDVFDAAPSGKYERLARSTTRPGARTGLWSSELDRPYVASPSRNGHPAEIHVLAPPNGV